MVRTRKQHNTDRSVVACFSESIVEFNGGQWRERIATLRTVDRDLCDAVKRFVDDLFVFFATLPGKSLMDASPFLSRFIAVISVARLLIVRLCLAASPRMAQQRAPPALMPYAQKTPVRLVQIDRRFEMYSL